MELGKWDGLKRKLLSTPAEAMRWATPELKNPGADSLKFFLGKKNSGLQLCLGLNPGRVLGVSDESVPVMIAEGSGSSQKSANSGQSGLHCPPKLVLTVVQEFV